MLRRIHAGEAIDKIVERPDGRSYAVSVRPIANGGWVTTHQDVTEKTRAEREVLHLAHYDPLTELTNRGLFQARSAAPWHDCASTAIPSAFCCSISTTSKVNDTLVISPATGCWSSGGPAHFEPCGRRVARLGGDEFAILQLAK